MFAQSSRLNVAAAAGVKPVASTVRLPSKVSVPAESPSKLSRSDVPPGLRPRIVVLPLWKSKLPEPDAGVKFRVP